MLYFYQWLMGHSEGALESLLKKRLHKGKEDGARLNERRGTPNLARPSGKLVWLHAASVGEAQSALILINALLNAHPDIHILVTTGTLTSAKRMQDSLPPQAIHQFIPLDSPSWAAQFIDYWQPDLVLWMESELWPNLLLEIKKRKIPAALINARLSKRSYRGWKLFRSSAQQVLETFQIILAQTHQDAKRFKKLGVSCVEVTDNLKYSAAPLECDTEDLNILKHAIGERPLCVYASTHAGEEAMAMRVHMRLEHSYPELLSIIIPRHPNRGDEILKLADTQNIKAVLRGDNKALPDQDSEIYIADTLGELGLFYRLSDIVYIGRSLSDDGGGGHNPIEAAQLKSAIIHGKHIQNLQDIYDDMAKAQANLCVNNEEALYEALKNLLSNPAHKKQLIVHAENFANAKSHVIDRVIDLLDPLLIQSGIKAL